MVIHICLPVFVFRLSRRGMFAAPVGIVNKREGIQNPTLTAKTGQAYPKKRPSVKPGTRNIPEHTGTFRNIPEHPGT